MTNSTSWRVPLLIVICFSAIPASVRSFHPMANALRDSLDARPEDKGIAQQSEVTANQDGEGDHGLNSQGFLKYFVHDPQDEDQIAAIKRHHEGNDYINLDSNELEKRRNTMDFLRFGRSGEALSSEEKRVPRNFLRFGRIPQNFLRFGKGGPGPLEMAYGLQGDDDFTESEEKRARNFLRFGRADIMRQHRAPTRNFLRFGRSVNEDETKSEKLSSEPSDSLSPKVRSKRSSSLYDDAMFMTQAPLTWPTDLGSFVLGQGSSAYTHPQETLHSTDKRGHGRNFLRYGRHPLDLDFLRFGKRSSGEINPDEDNMARMARSEATRNFLRFG